MLDLLAIIVGGSCLWVAGYLTGLPNRGDRGRFVSSCRAERAARAILYMVAIFALVFVAGCTAVPRSAVSAGSTSGSSSASTAPVYAPAPVPQPRTESTGTATYTPTTLPTTVPSPVGQWSVSWHNREWWAPTYPPASFATTRTSTDTNTGPTASGDDASLEGIGSGVTKTLPKSWGGWWITICLLIAAGCAIVASIVPHAKQLYWVAGAAAALAALALVPPTYLGVALLIVVIVSVVAVGVLAYRGGRWRLATEEVVAGVEVLKGPLEAARKEINKTLRAEQSESTEKLVRKARGKA